MSRAASAPSLMDWLLAVVAMSGVTPGNGTLAWGAEPRAAVSSPAGAGPRLASLPVADVALRPDGTLAGRILRPTDGQPTTVAQVPITLLENQRVVARVQSDAEGRFAVAHLPGGVYQVRFDDAPLGTPRFCRVWSATGAPPQAAAELTLPRETPVVRGQSLLWANWPPSFPLVALTTGAVTAPIVYHNVHQDNRVPISP